MAEKRKPVLTMLVRGSGVGSSDKVELYHCRDFGMRGVDMYRIRFNGVWVPKGRKYEFYDIAGVMRVFGGSFKKLMEDK